MDMDSYNVSLLFSIIVSNHRSNGIILKELVEAYNHLYNGEPLEKINKTKFSEFIKYINNNSKNEEKSYWGKYLKD